MVDPATQHVVVCTAECSCLSVCMGPPCSCLLQYAATLPDCDHYLNYPLRSLLVGTIPSSQDPSRAIGVLQVFNKGHEQTFTSTDLFKLK